MFLSNAAIKRPVAMGCLIIAFALLGLNSFRKMGLESMPKLDLPFITIVTVYPGAAPEEIETDVAKRIEDAMMSIDGLKHISSACMENVNQTLLEFELSVDVDVAATDVREKLDLIRADFPEDVEDPEILKFDINAKPVIIMALTGDAPIDDLYDYAKNDFKDRVTRIEGVAEVEFVGGAEREVHVLADRKKLEARGLGIMDLYRAIKTGVRTIPSGRIQDDSMEYNVKFKADFDSISDIEGIEIAGENGQRCRIGDIGRVEMTTAELRQIAAVDGRPAISISVVKKADANTAAVTERIKSVMNELESALPGGMELVWVTDDGHFVESTVNSAWEGVGMGVVLTAFILFFFLYNFRNLLIVCITMPLTIVIGLFFMEQAGFTLNTSTLIAIAMSVGILVTNSIVVLEAITKRIKENIDPKEASALGAKETVIAVLASAGTNVVVLFPLTLMESQVGMFIKPLALTMVMMTLVSLFISFSLTPMLCSLMLKPENKGQKGLLNRMEDGWNHHFNRIIAAYRKLLGVAEKRRTVSILIVLVTLVVFIHSASLMKHIGTSMVPDTDKGEIFLKIEFPTRYNLSETWRRIRNVEESLSDLPELQHRLSTVGKVEGVLGQSSEGVYLGQIMLKFSERDQRDASIHDLLTMIRNRIREIPEAIVTLSIPTMIGGNSSPIDMAISGDSLNTLNLLALKTKTIAQEIPGFRDIDTSVRTGKPEIRITPNRPVLADLNLAPVNLGITLRGNLEGLTAGTYKKADRNYDIVVLFEKMEGIDQVRAFQLPGSPGKPMLLETVADISQTRSPVSVNRKDKQRISKVFASLDSGKALGTAVSEISRLINEKGEFPPGYGFSFSGGYEVMKEGQGQLLEALLISIILVYLTLAAILESFKQPFLILVTLPLTMIGVMWALYITNTSMDIFAIMGCVMMVGIVVNNAILILDQFNINMAKGRTRHSAMIDAACDRARPIVMITVAAVLGMMPLAISRGIGAEIRNGIGVASMGGILVSGILTVILLPIIYSLFTRRNHKD